MNDEEGDNLEQNVTETAQESTVVDDKQEAETPPWEKKPEKPAAQETEKQDPDETQKKARGGFQRRIDELVREREYERSERAKLLDVIAKQQPVQQPAAPSTTQSEAVPDLKDFDSYEKYLAAFARYEVRQENAEERKRNEEATAKTKQEQAVAEQHKQAVEKQKATNKLVETAEKKYPDFYEKVFTQDPAIVPITPVIGDAILESDIGHDVAYYLATHPTEAQRLAKLSPTSALREFGKIEASLGKQHSGAPPPINPLNGKKSSDDTKINPTEDYESFLRKRNKQLGRT